MQNTRPNSTVRATKKAPLYDEKSRSRWFGWTDVRDGVDGYRKDYDSWSSIDQENYERGRCLAVVCKREWGYVPEWNPSTLLSKALTADGVMDDVFAEMVLEQKFFNEDKTRKK